MIVLVGYRTDTIRTIPMMGITVVRVVAIVGMGEVVLSEQTALTALPAHPVQTEISWISTVQSG